MPGFGAAAIIIMQIQICAISLSECCYFFQTFITTFSTPFLGKLFLTNESKVIAIFMEENDDEENIFRLKIKMRNWRVWRYLVDMESKFKV